MDMNVLNDRGLTFDNELDVATDLVLPAQLKSFLIHGDYPPAHPINLCLSQLAREPDPHGLTRCALLITAQPRSRFIEALTSSDLAKISGLGRVSGLLSKIRI